LLKMARLGRGGIKPAPLDLSRMGAEIVAELRANEPGREVAVEIAPGLQATGDPSLVRNLLQNLIGNAWKFTAERDDAVIRLRRHRRDGIDVFSVEDNGAGFDMAYAHKMFDPFQRLHSAAEFEGTGIGLAIVARIVTRHGGRIRADGRPGHGATFRFTLTPAPAGWELR
jgi:light-regulated signal transduction histidine kinase (bacteriophytochrome)